MSSRVSVGSRDEVLPGALGTDVSATTVVCRSVPQLDAIVGALENAADGEVRLLLSEDVSASLTRHDPVALRLVSQVEAHDVRVRSNSLASVLPCLVIKPDLVCSILLDQTRNVLSIHSDFERTENPYEVYTHLWEEGDPVSFRTPGLAEIVETAADELDPAFGRDLDEVYAGGPDADTTTDPLTVEEVVLLLAGKHELPFYDVKRWAEDVGLSSRSTLSRRRSSLEAIGLLESEKIPVDVGRPRLRLLLNRDAFDELDPSRVVETARRIRGD